MFPVRWYLLDLSGQHAALYSQHSGDVDILPTHVIHPLGEAVHCGLKKFPGELYDVEDSLDDVVFGQRTEKEPVTATFRWEFRCWFGCIHYSPGPPDFLFSSPFSCVSESSLTSMVA